MAVRRIFWLAAALTLAAAVAWPVWSVRPQSVAGSTVRVGVDHSPPFYSIARNGSVSGLAVDVINEAARRRGVRVVWAPLRDIPIDDALRTRTVQLWPLVGVTAERSRRFFLTRPWLETSYVLVSRRERPVRTPAQAAGLAVAHARLRLTTLLVQQFLAASKPLVRIYREDAVRAVCTGEASAVLVESRVLDSLLLSRPAGCEQTQFAVATLPGATFPLAIAAVPEQKAVAEALREEISHLARDGFFGGRLDEWSPFSAEGTRSVWAEEAANTRSRAYRYGMLGIALFSIVLGLLARRAWRLKKFSERAESALRETQRRFTAFIDNSPAVAFMKDSRGRFLYVNRAWSNLFGLAPEQVVGKTEFALWPPDVARTLRDTDRELLAGSEPRQLIENVPVSAGDTRELLTFKFPFAGEGGETCVGGTSIDITERQKAIRQLASSEARYRELFDHNPLPAWVYDLETLDFLNVNEAAIRHYGWSREDFLTGIRLPELLTSDGMRHIAKDGRILQVDVTGYELDYRGRRARLMIVRDVSEQQRIMEELRLSEERWQLALHGAGDALWDWDLRTGSVFRSARWSAMLGYEECEIGDSREDFLRLLHPGDVLPVQNAVDAYLARQTPSFFVEYRLRHRDGTWRWIMDRGQAVWDERGRPIRIAGSHTDVTERRLAQEQLAREARTDSLTGLLNRREFERHSERHMSEALSSGKPLCVCICDLDYFKEVNDSYGHATGDDVLSAFAQILRANIRKSDVIARVGGDEFLLSLPNTNAQEARALVERIREELYRAEFMCNAARFRVSASFGVAELKRGVADVKSPAAGAAELIAEADRMLYAAKHEGRNRIIAA